ncbi:hypothetical protein MASR2M18_17650 [Ignavibacteria bacterium]|nr:DUF3108 domain-containing protein [Bacteroidota bacterium]MCZ2132867.1 DUF3108 domain-containing protein [Bacteroidota bacterium]
MNVRSTLVIFSVALFLIILSTFTGTAQNVSPVLQAGEELEYEVSFLGITLGYIKMTTEQQTDASGQSVIVCKSYIDSRPGIPFVELHSVFNSWLDKSCTFSRQFTANTKESDDSWTFDKYVFDYEAGKFTTEKFKRKQLTERKEFVTKKKWNDGCSLFYTARQLLFVKRNVRIPTVMMADTVATTIAFSGKEENIEIDAINYPVKTIYFNGEATWTGIYGVTGKFEGWFSNDAARVPIRAKMKLYVGNANIELVRWKRAGWTPPEGE